MLGLVLYNIEDNNIVANQLAFRYVDVTTPKENIKQMDDTDIIRHIQSTGDMRYIEALYEKHKPFLYNLVRRMENDFSLHEEIMQEVYTRIVFGIGSFRGESLFTSWAFRVAYNVISAHISKQLAKKNFDKQTSSLNQKAFNDDINVTLLDLLEDTANDLTRPEEYLEYHEYKAIIEDLIENQEDPHFRIVLQLHYHEHLTDEQAAERLGIPVGSVKSRLHYARKKLKQDIIDMDLPFDHPM